jgi:nucleotidyltransferase/DNA polymerase involved in DNA repair
LGNQFKIHLATEIQYLKGVGPKRGKFLNGMGIHYINDLVRNFPRFGPTPFKY